MTGKAIVVASWASVAAFALPAGLEALGAHAVDDATVAISLTLFLASLGVWTYAFGLAVLRSARGDEIGVSSLFFLAGSAPGDVRRHLLGATAVSVIVALATMFTSPYVVLVPMLPLGLAGLWAARHGTFPPRRMRAVSRGDRR